MTLRKLVTHTNAVEFASDAPFALSLTLSYTWLSLLKSCTQETGTATFADFQSTIVQFGNIFEILWNAFVQIP